MHPTLSQQNIHSLAANNQNQQNIHSLTAANQNQQMLNQQLMAGNQQQLLQGGQQLLQGTVFFEKNKCL